MCTAILLLIKVSNLLSIYLLFDSWPVRLAVAEITNLTMLLGAPMYYSAAFRSSVAGV